MNAPLTIHTFSQDTISYVAPTWDQLHGLAFDVACQIRAEEVTFDRVITLAKGGWPMSRSVADFLEISEVQSLGISFYKGIDERKAKPTMYQELPVSIEGEHVLLFDDVADTGESLQFSLDYLKQKGAASVTTATIFYKKRSQVVPDYFASLAAEWIIFPYELVETLKDVGTRWLADGVEAEEVISRFVTLQFNEAQVRYFMETTLLVE